jgi:hypothetical protein
MKCTFYVQYTFSINLTVFEIINQKLVNAEEVLRCVCISELVQTSEKSLCTCQKWDIGHIGSHNECTAQQAEREELGLLDRGHVCLKYGTILLPAQCGNLLAQGLVAHPVYLLVETGLPQITEAVK